jgi:hypothetical protein
VGAAGQGDVVEADAGCAFERDLEPRQLDCLHLAGEGATDPGLRLVALDRGEEADGAEVDAEDRHTGPGEAPQRVQDGSVAAEHQADVGARLVAGDLDAAGGGTVLGQLVLGAHQPPARLPRDPDRNRNRFRRRRRVRVGDQGGGAHASSSTAARIAPSRSATGGEGP